VRTSGPLWTASLALDRTGLPVLGRWPSRVVTYQTLADQSSSLLRAWGMSEEHTAITVPHLLHADLHGIDSHGCGMLREYHHGVVAGRLTTTPIVSVVTEGPSTALVDGGGGLGHVPADLATRIATAKCERTGVGAVTVRNSGHFGAAGSYAAIASAAGLIGIVTSNCMTPAVVPTRGVDAVLGTNPIACAAPTSDPSRPFLLDMATSTVPVGRLVTYRRRGRSLPRGWALDRAGRPVTDPRRAIAARRLLPLGSTPELSSHKGYGLAAMVELLSSALPGLRSAPGGAQRVGHFVLVLDPDRFTADGAFESAMGGLVEQLRASTPLDPAEPVLVAGDPEHDAREERTRTGIPLSRFLVEELREVCRASDVPFLLDRTGG
jgi:LDH2 family malate/lactate/ureidoglycolate dehydrogenase